jgi:hypothetical protein
MTVDIAFDFAKVYNIERADIAVGQKFKLFTDFENGRFFSDNDQVLSLRPNGKEVEGTADEVGDTTILIMDDQFTIQKKLTIKVVEAIVDPAASLGITAGEPQPK